MEPDSAWVWEFSEHQPKRHELQCLCTKSHKLCLETFPRSDAWERCLSQTRHQRTPESCTLSSDPPALLSHCLQSLLATRHQPITQTKPSPPNFWCWAASDLPRRNYTDKELINDMIVPLLHQWTKANALFKPPVINQCRTIELKLTKLWHKAVETSLGKGNLARKNEFLHTLDTLFDILTCKCSIQLCSESNCSHSGKRENNSHIDCGCPREKKIPVLELEFIKAQRTKAEGQGSVQMGSIDYSETKKQIANAKKREQIREREQKKKMKSEEAIQREEELCQDVYHFFDSSSDEQEATSDDIPPINVNATKLSELVDLSLEVLEPPLTTSLTSQELRNLKETPMQVPKWPSHTQSVERCVKMVTEAAGHVYSHERREVLIITICKNVTCCVFLGVLHTNTRQPAEVRKLKKRSEKCETRRRGVWYTTLSVVTNHRET
ncbi:hypothetical protein Hamer_G024834 [Homarus americanus]|uniref:Uncharacterized protein n=1 Tax=Homarus americanus TaxID=6706 RepID=A0A8J5K2D1_HOMAM|nr:hypothetical protein Hamer_G024834 [Homarus americanus]